MKKLKQYAVRRLGEEYLLIPRWETALLSNQVFSMSETAAFIYEHAGEISCEEDMARLLTKEYEVDMDTARADTKEVLAFLKRAGILAD